jgi:hypothetical protein
MELFLLFNTIYKSQTFRVDLRRWIETFVCALFFQEHQASMWRVEKDRSTLPDYTGVRMPFRRKIIVAGPHVIAQRPTRLCKSAANPFGISPHNLRKMAPIFKRRWIASFATISRIGPSIEIICFRASVRHASSCGGPESLSICPHFDSASPTRIISTGIWFGTVPILTNWNRVGSTVTCCDSISASKCPILCPSI